MRFKTLWIGGLAAALLGPAFGQGPGGGRGGFTTDRNERFSQYTNGKDVWSRADIRDPDQQRSFDRVAQQLGVTNGSISRQQYLEYYQQLSERFGGQRSAANPTMMAIPGGAAGTAGFPGVGSTTPPTLQSPVPSSPPGSGRSRGGWGSPEGMANMADFSFRRADLNGDGVLSNNEISDILRNELDRFDTNRDGVIDANEYRSFFEARIQQRQSERTTGPVTEATTGGSFGRSFGNRSGPGSASFDPSAAMSMMRGGAGSFDPNSLRMNRGDRSVPSSSQRQTEPSSPRAIVYRPGNLPSGLPSWFQQRDTDGDGQVGLYEWLASGTPISEFQRLDTNGDGFITVEEVLRDQKGFNSTAVAAHGNGSAGGQGGSLGGSLSGSQASGAKGLPVDREQLLEMMSRGREMREAMMRGGSGGMPGWMGNRGTESSNSNGKSLSSGERSSGKGRGGNGEGSGESRDQGFGGRRGKGRGGDQ